MNALGNFRFVGLTLLGLLSLYHNMICYDRNPYPKR